MAGRDERAKTPSPPKSRLISVGGTPSNEAPLDEGDTWEEYSRGALSLGPPEEHSIGSKFINIATDPGMPSRGSCLLR